MFKKVVLLVLILCGVVMITSCDHKKQATDVKKYRIIVAKLEKSVSSLHYSGSVLPLTLFNIISPVDGHIAKINFQYGSPVFKGDKIASMRSDALSDTFKKSVNDYLQKKDAFLTGRESFLGTQMLFKAGVVEKSSYLSEKSSYEDKVLDYYQSIYALEGVLKHINIDSKEIFNLSISDAKKINLLLNRRFNNIPLVSSTKGIALFPVNTDQNSNDDKSGKLTVGAEVKKGQSILSVGDLSGLKMSFYVNEVDVNRIKKRMKAIITGNAFPSIKLDGYISSVSFQADPNQGQDSGTSMFAVEVTVPHITLAQQKVIHVGMTAQVMINITSAPSILLPIAAVKRDNGSSYVIIQGPNNQQRKVSVTTGSTTLDKVEIIKGIHVGDKVVVYDSH